MIVELGHFALILALIVAAVQAAVPVAGFYGPRGWTAVARPAAHMLFALVSFSFLALVWAFVTSDFSVVTVIENGYSHMPFLYKIAAAWGNHEGSMLLWVWMLAFWGFCVTLFTRGETERFVARVLSTQGLIAFGFILFILLTSNPFLRTDTPPAEGMGLNPVLQDPALAIHPPLLYAGYVGFSIAFCFAVAALLEKRVDADWARQVRPWVLAAWIALSAGIVKGAIWAYYELGWGGFWFWDPVENASLMPWFVGTALLHSIAVLQRRDTLKVWTVFLAILAFSFSLLGTFLVRSGILTSVHAFATDPARGIFILVLLALSIGGAFFIYALKAPAIKSGADIAPVSRETSILLNNVFLFTFCVTVFLGTLYPVFMNAFDLGSVSVGPPYYAATMLPLLVPFVFLLGVAPMLAWQKNKLNALMPKLVAPAVATLSAVIVVYALSSKPDTFVLLGTALGVWIISASLADAGRKAGSLKAWRALSKSYHGMIIAHIGFAVLILGVTAVSRATSENILWMTPGSTVDIAGKTLTFAGTTAGLGENYNIDAGLFVVNDGGEPYTLAPEKRWYPVAGKETSEVALHRDGFGLLYATLGDQDKKNPARWVVRLYHHPYILLVFLGGLMMYGGGLLAALDRRARKVSHA